jgi:HD-GYP domain-containing protein (c-di-GMP phosphodiesterase class II)
MPDTSHLKYPPRIDKRVMNHKYTSHSFSILVKETVLPFDCYIKRYSDYVIIIQAGTYITEELLQKMHHNKEIYFLKEDSQKIRDYQTEHETIDLSQENTVSAKKPIKAALDLPQTMLNLFGTLEERLCLLYGTTSNLMQMIFDEGDEKLPLDALYTCVNQFAACIHPETNTLPMLLKIIPDEYTTHHHSTNVGFLAVILANAIHLSQEEIIDVGFAGLLHDIGKIRIDSNILLKPSKLKDTEYETVKNHSDYGYAILTDNGISNPKILNGVHFHHERLDGSGYPKGLRAKLVPKYAQIVGMCDAFDALTTKRTFRDNYTSFEALLVMKQDMAAQLDKNYINTFIGLMSA